MNKKYYKNGNYLIKKRQLINIMYNLYDYFIIKIIIILSLK